MTGASAGASRPIRVLLIGHSSDSTTALQSSLSALRPDVEVSWRGAMQHAPESETPPDVVVVFQEHPEDNSPQQIRKLLNSSPLARWIVCYGPWCESDGRTRQLWPVACRVPRSMLLPRLCRELSVALGEAPPLPLTANRDECWESSFAAAPMSAGQQLGIAISSPDPAIAEWLEEALRTAGHRIESLSHETADVLLFDADPWTAQRAEALAKILRQHHALPIVALTGYPRAAQQQALREAGVMSVLLKLAPLSELHRTLEEATAVPREFRPNLHIVREP